jgi:hypothetical protein
MIGQTTAADDAVLLGAERQLAELRSSDVHKDIWQLIDVILLTPPRTLAGAAVKLRLLCDAEIGIFAAGASDQEEVSLRQVLAFVEAMSGGGAE